MPGFLKLTCESVSPDWIKQCSSTCMSKTFITERLHSAWQVWPPILSVCCNSCCVNLCTVVWPSEKALA